MPEPGQTSQQDVPDQVRQELFAKLRKVAEAESYNPIERQKNYELQRRLAKDPEIKSIIERYRGPGEALTYIRQAFFNPYGKELLKKQMPEDLSDILRGLYGSESRLIERIDRLHFYRLLDNGFVIAAGGPHSNYDTALKNVLKYESESPFVTPYDDVPVHRLVLIYNVSENRTEADRQADERILARAGAKCVWLDSYASEVTDAESANDSAQAMSSADDEMLERSGSL